MSAPKGNQFWKIRTKHGRDKIFTNPKVLLEAAYEYFQWNENNPKYTYEVIKSGPRTGELIPIPTGRPMTIEALTQFIGVNKRYFDYFEGKSLLDKPIDNLVNPWEEDEDFYAVISHIREVIYRQKFEGAAVGQFNANIIARELGMVDKVEAKNTNLNLNSDVVVTEDEAIKIKNALLKDY